ncbi:MAG: STAS domain-containing protein [Planctomycetota bacterium]|jgi:anti-sigma B factor antagonist
MDDKVNVKITSEGDVAVAAFEAVSISNVEGVAVASVQINKFVEEKHPTKIVFDFEGVKFFSSQVLGVLLDVHSKLKAYGGEVVISAINPQLHRVFKITNLDKVFRFFPDKKSAVEAVNPD